MSLYRTSLIIPTALRKEAIRIAKKENISMAELIREGLEKIIGAKKNPWENSPFFKNKTVIQGTGPKNISINHDQYIYESIEDVHGEKRLAKKMAKEKSLS